MLVIARVVSLRVVGVGVDGGKCLLELCHEWLHGVIDCFLCKCSDVLCNAMSRVGWSDALRLR